MSELESRDDSMGRLLRRSMAAPVPRLSADFHPQVSREIRRRMAPPHPFGQVLLKGYVAVSVLTSIAVMRSQGLEWTLITATTIAALGVLELARRLRPAPIEPL